MCLLLSIYFIDNLTIRIKKSNQLGFQPPQDNDKVDDDVDVDVDVDDNDDDDDDDDGDAMTIALLLLISSGLTIL